MVENNNPLPDALTAGRVLQHIEWLIERYGRWGEATATISPLSRIVYGQGPERELEPEELARLEFYIRWAAWRYGDDELLRLASLPPLE